MSRRHRRTKEKRRRHSPVPSRRVRAATITGSVAATAALGLAASAGPADAASFEAAMVKNINPSGGSDPSSFAAVGDTLFFSADDGTHGAELWKSDGTDAGTQLVKDINTGNGGADSSFPQHLTNVGSTLFFSAYDATSGRELWMSVAPFDAAHTTLVKDINTGNGGADSSTPQALTNVGGKLFFSAIDATHGREPWVAVSPFDDTKTTLVRDINTSATVDSNPTQFIEIGGTVLFNATDGNDNGGTQHGYELWKSESPFDSDSTTLAEDIKPGLDSNPTPLIDMSGTLLFSADNMPNGRELWKSASPFTNATLVADINTTPTAPADSHPRDLTDVGGTLLFNADDGMNGRELWKSVPPFTGATLVKNINPTGDGYPYHLTDVGGTLFFNANDGSGPELWKSAYPFDASTTTLVKDINPSGGSVPRYLTSAGGMLFFAAFDATSGQELWSSDGTATGTTQVKDIYPGADGSYPYELIGVGNNLFFKANDGTNGAELWKASALPGPATGGGGPAPVTTALTFNLKAAIARCKKKFPKGPKRKKCIRKARAKANA